MSIHIYNSLSKKKEEFIPLKPKRVNIYTCGVTVYDECHIGHARSLYIFDVIRRYLRYRGYKVKFIRNITDIDDKIINKAKELGISAKEVAEKWTNSYYRDIELLGIKKADVEPKATEHIQDMIAHIQGLLEGDFAYIVDGDVYFRVKKFKDYGKLSGQNLEQMLSGARIEKDERKEDPLDFALWKRSKEGEPSWRSPWGAGRPGWHIECSVMSAKYLGEAFDIHAGGRDLIFPHHENEIAQAQALTGKTFAKYWLHHGLLTINGQKMAKSLGNFITIRDFIAKYKDIDILKLFFLSTHYAHPIDYNPGKLDEAAKQKNSFAEFFDKLNYWPMLKRKIRPLNIDKDKNEINNICDRFFEAMDNDFNTPQALACLFELKDLGLEFISSDKEAAFKYVYEKLKELFNIFGLKLKPKKKLDPKIIKLIRERDIAKQNKDFKKADAIRKEIQEKHKFYIIDTATNVTLIETEQ